MDGLVFFLALLFSWAFPFRCLGFVMMNVIAGNAFPGAFFFFFFFVFQSSDVLWSEYEKRMERNRKGKITTEIRYPDLFVEQRAGERRTSSSSSSSPAAAAAAAAPASSTSSSS